MPFCSSRSNPMDSKKVIIFAVLACVLLSVCIDQTSAQMGLRWGRELEDEWERAAQRAEYPWHKRGAQKKRGIIQKKCKSSVYFK